MARKIPEINSSSQADIAFMLLIFFLVTTTMDVDSGISRVLPPYVPEEQQQDQKNEVKERNVLEVLVNSSDRLLVERKPARLEDLKDKVKEFYLNPTDDENLPEKYEREVDHFGVVKVSKGVISLRNDQGTTYGMYIKVQNQIAQAVNELRDQLAVQQFGRKLDDLPEDKQKAVREVFPNTVSEAEPKKTK